MLFSKCESLVTSRYKLLEMLFYFTVTLDEARIALLFLRESFAINFLTRDGTIFRKPTRSFSIASFAYSLRRRSRSFAINRRSTLRVRDAFAKRGGSFSGFLIELSHNLSQSFCEVIQLGLENSDFLPLDSDTSCARECRG